MPANILITGGTGLIGFQILLAALSAGHKVCYTARSEAKAKVVSSNPAVQKLSVEDRLSTIIIEDFSVDGAFDRALEGITHVIHVGSPVPVPTYDPVTEVFQPTLRITENLLSSALKVPTVKRVVITSSIVGNMTPLPDASIKVTASSRVQLPNPSPKSFENVFDAYFQAKILELNATDKFVKTNDPSFSVCHAIPGYVFGRNELALDIETFRQGNSSNNFMVLALTGGAIPFPIHGGYAHIEDVANVHLHLAFKELQPGEPTDFGISSKVDYESIFGYVEKAFPKAVAEGIFSRGQLPTLPVWYDSSETEKVFGTKFKSFEKAVLDVASQYLELLGKEKA